MKRTIYVDLLREKIDTITPENGYQINNYISIFSPSGNKLICYTCNDNGPHGYVYTVNSKELKKLPEQFPFGTNIDDIVLLNDNEYYYLYDNALYKGNLTSNTAPSKVRDFGELELSYCHYIDSENIGAGNNYDDHVIVYNLKQDSITYRTKEHSYDIVGYDIRGMNSKYLVSSYGVFDLKQDSLIVDSYNDMYMWNNKSIKIAEEDEKFVMSDMNGIVIKTINRDNSDDNYSLLLRDNFLYSYGSSGIFIYNLGAKLNRRVKITEYDKKLFDLE